MKFPFLSNNECKVVAAPIEDETQEFSKKSISELTLLEKHYQQRVFRKNYTNTNMLPSDITKSLNDAQNTLVIIQKILRQKLEEQDRAKSLAQQQYVNEESAKAHSKHKVLSEPTFKSQCVTLWCYHRHFKMAKNR